MKASKPTQLRSERRVNNKLTAQHSEHEHTQTAERAYCLSLHSVVSLFCRLVAAADPGEAVGGRREGPEVVVRDGACVACNTSESTSEIKENVYAQNAHSNISSTAVKSANEGNTTCQHEPSPKPPKITSCLSTRSKARDIAARPGGIKLCATATKHATNGELTRNQ